MVRALKTAPHAVGDVTRVFFWGGRKQALRLALLGLDGLDEFEFI